MSDLAALGMRFHTEGADSANRQLDQIADKSEKAEKATDALSSSQRKATGATAEMTGGIIEAVSAQREITDALSGFSKQAAGAATEAMGLTGSMASIAQAAVPVLASMGLLGGLAVVIGSVAVASLQGEADSLRFANAIAITGNYAQITTSQYEAMVKTVQAGAESGFGTARKTLLGLISTGELTNETVGIMSQNIIRMAQYTGKSADDMARQFAGMGDKVGDFAVKFNSNYHMLSLAQIEHIQLLESQGKTTEAQLAMAIGMHERLGEIGPAKLGFLEQAWRGVANAISWAWEQLKGFGRDSGIEAQIAKIDGAIAANEKKLGIAPGFNDGLRAQRAALQAVLDTNKAQGENARIQQDGVEAAERMRTTWGSMGDNIGRARGEIARYRADIEAIRKANPNSTNIPSAERQAAAEADILKKYTPDATAAVNRARSAAESAAAAEARRAAALARDLEALRATTRANHDLAAAYGVSDAEALKATASAEAVGRAVKRQGDVDAFVSAQLELNASKLVAAAAQQASDLRFSADGQERMNTLIAAGTISSQDATEQMALEAKLRPLIAAAAVVEGKAKADLLGQVDALTKATERMNKANRESSIARSETDASNHLEVLRLERDLIGANNIERARQLAMLEEEIRLRDQYGKAFVDSSRGQAMIGRAGDNAAYRETTQKDVARYNLALTEQLDLLRQIDDHTRSAAQGLAESFGSGGRAVGDVAASLTSYRARLEEIAVARDQMAREGTLNSEREAIFARDAAQAQIQSYGDMLGAAKGFFSEGSDGYRALQAAEAAYRVFQFAMSVQAMAMGAAETSAHVAQSGTKAAASTAEGAAKMFAQLGPYAFPVVAAMIALLAGLGMKGKGGGGGGSSPSLDASVSTSQGYGQQADAVQSSFAASVAQKVEVKVTADRDGLNAYVVETAGEVARPMVMQGMAAASGATRAQVMADLDKGRTYSRGTG